MILKHQFFTVLLITLLLYVENSEAGWKFWQRETTTTTTTTPYSVSNNYPQSITTPTKIGGPMGPIVTATNTATSTITQQGPAIGVNGAQQNVRNNARPNQPNPGTEVGQDIIVPRPNRPGIGGGNGQTYQNWAMDFAGVGEPVQNQPSRTSGLATNGGSQTRPNLPTDFRPSPSNIPFQPTQPSIAGSRNTPQPNMYDVNILTPRPPRPTFIGPVTPVSPVRVDQNNPNSPSNGQTWANGGTRGSGSPTGFPRQPEYPGTPVRVDQNNPNSPSNGRTWADVAGRTRGSGTPTGLPRQPEYPGENEREVTPGTPTQPGQLPNQPNRPSPGVAVKPAAGAATGAPVVYSSDPTYSKGNTVTNEDLEKLSEALYIKDRSNANRYVTVNLQGQTTSSNPTDQAPQPILTVNPEAFQIRTIQTVLSIFDNYHLDTLTREHISPAQREEESRLVDTFLSTDVMSAAMRFLAKKGFVKQDYYEYKALLRQIWFDLFSRGQGRIGSSGFEHVFMAETKQVDSGTDVLGLHNWIFFNAEETKNHVDYLGYIKKVDLGNKGSIVKMHAKFNGYDKPVVTVFIGTSPELEMALYTVCFYARPDGNCPVSLGGTKFNIITHKFKYRGKDLIGTAYPDI